MKKLSLYVFLVLIFFSTNNAYVWEKIPVPDHVNKKTKSPWNFYENFESKSLKKLKINNKGSGKKPFKFKQDKDGNTFLAITVKDKSNKDMGSAGVTERAELGTGYKNTKNKEVWYGFKIRFPKDFIHINDRLLITQFKNQFNPMKKSPLLGIRFYQNGEILDIGGDTGGNPAKWYNKKEHKKHAIRSKFLKNNDILFLNEIKDRESDYKKMSTCSNNNCAGCLDYETRKICCYGVDGKPVWKKKSYLNSGEKPSFCNKVEKIKKQIKVNKLGEWITFKIGIKNSKQNDGYVKVYRNDELVMNYSGITYDWKGGQYKGTDIRIGPYRNSDPNGDGYPDQTIHFDDFIVVSDKKTLDKYLN